jgi:hypothetical protein
VLAAAYCQALTSSLAQAFDVDVNSQIINISSTLPSGGDVVDVWAAMQLSGSLEKHMQSVTSESQARKQHSISCP